MTKRIKPKWQLEKEQSKRGTFDSLNDFANSLQEAFNANTTTLFENRNDEIRKKADQLSKRLDELERKIKEF